MTPTAEQIKQAQESGNEAFEYTIWDALGTPAQAYDAYRAAYDATLAALQAAEHESGVTAEWTPAPDTAEMIRIVQDAMRNDPPIEY